MNTSTGHLLNPDHFFKMKADEPTQASKYVEVKRDLTALETSTMQIQLYARCGCGSGKKFKFCCHKK